MKRPRDAGMNDWRRVVREEGLSGDNAEAAARARAQLEKDVERYLQGESVGPEFAALCARWAREDAVSIYYLALITAERAKKSLFWSRVAAVFAILAFIYARRH